MCVDHSKLQTKVLKESRFLSNHPIYHPDCDHSTFEVFLWTRPELEMIVGIEIKVCLRDAIISTNPLELLEVVEVWALDRRRLSYSVKTNRSDTQFPTHCTQCTGGEASSKAYQGRHA
jgi:hypothetical protein